MKRKKQTYETIHAKSIAKFEFLFFFPKYNRGSNIRIYDKLPFITPVSEVYVPSQRTPTSTSTF